MWTSVMVHDGKDNHLHFEFERELTELVACMKIKKSPTQPLNSNDCILQAHFQNTVAKKVWEQIMHHISESWCFPINH